MAALASTFPCQAADHDHAHEGGGAGHGHDHAHEHASQVQQMQSVGGQWGHGETLMAEIQVQHDHGQVWRDQALSQGPSGQGLGFDGGIISMDLRVGV